MWALIKQKKSPSRWSDTEIKNLSEELYWLKVILKFLRKFQVIKYCAISLEKSMTWTWLNNPFTKSHHNSKST